MTHPIDGLVQIAREASTSALTAAIYQQVLDDPQSIAEVTVAALITLAGQPEITTPQLLAALDRSMARDNEMLDGQIRVYRAALAQDMDPARLADEMARIYLLSPTVAAVVAATAVLRLARQ